MRLLLLLAACRSVPETTAQVCPEGELDDAGSCVPVECGQGTWGNLDVDEHTIFVDAAAEEGGDGTEAGPFQTIGDGLKAAEATGAPMVAVAAGSYAESVQLGGDLDGLHLAGRCAALVVMEGDPELVEEGVLARGNATWTLSGLTITGFTPGIYQKAGRLALREIQIVDNLEAGLWSELRAIAIDLDGVVISGTRASGLVPAGAPDGNGAVVSGATFVMKNSEISDNRYSGLTLVNSKAEIIDSAVTDTQADPEAGGGFGLAAQGSEVTFVESKSIRNMSTAFYTETSDLTLSGGVIGETLGDGQGLYCREYCTLAISSTVFQENVEAAIRLQTSSATLEGVIIEGTRTNEDDYAGGLQLTQSEVVAEGCTWTNNQAASIIASASALTLTDALVEHTAEGLGPAMAVGIFDASTLLATDVKIEDSASFGLIVNDSSATWTGGGVWNSLLGKEDWGYAMEVLHGGALVLRSATLDGNYLGILVYDGSADISDTIILNTGKDQDTSLSPAIVAMEFSTVIASGVSIVGTEGPALVATGGSAVSCASCTLEGSTFASAIAYFGAELGLGPGTTISNTAFNGATLGGGIGVVAGSILSDIDDADEEEAYGPVVVVLDGVQISESALASVYLAGAGSYSIRNSTLEGGIDGSASTIYPYGNAVFAIDGVDIWDEETSTGLLLQDNTLNASPGGAVFLHGSSATLDGNTYVDNTIDLLQQGCGESPLAPEGWEEVNTSSFCSEYDRQVERLDFYLYFPSLDLED